MSPSWLREHAAGQLGNSRPALLLASEASRRWTLLRALRPFFSVAVVELTPRVTAVERDWQFDVVLVVATLELTAMDPLFDEVARDVGKRRRAVFLCPDDATLGACERRGLFHLRSPCSLVELLDSLRLASEPSAAGRSGVAT